MMSQDKQFTPTERMLLYLNMSIVPKNSGTTTLVPLFRGDASPCLGWQNAHIIFVIITSIKETPLYIKGILLDLGGKMLV